MSNSIPPYNNRNINTTWTNQEKTGAGQRAPVTAQNPSADKAQNNNGFVTIRGMSFPPGSELASDSDLAACLVRSPLPGDSGESTLKIICDPPIGFESNVEGGGLIFHFNDGSLLELNDDLSGGIIGPQGDFFPIDNNVAELVMRSLDGSSLVPYDLVDPEHNRPLIHAADAVAERLAVLEELGWLLEGQDERWGGVLAALGERDDADAPSVSAATDGGQQPRALVGPELVLEEVFGGMPADQVGKILRAVYDSTGEHERDAEGDWIAGLEKMIAESLDAGNWDWLPALSIVDPSVLDDNVAAFAGDGGDGEPVIFLVPDTLNNQKQAYLEEIGHFFDYLLFDPEEGTEGDEGHLLRLVLTGGLFDADGEAVGFELFEDQGALWARAEQGELFERGADGELQTIAGVVRDDDSDAGEITLAGDDGEIGTGDDRTLAVEFMANDDFSAITYPLDMNALSGIGSGVDDFNPRAIIDIYGNGGAVNEAGLQRAISDGVIEMDSTSNDIIAYSHGLLVRKPLVDKLAGMVASGSPEALSNMLGDVYGEGADASALEQQIRDSVETGDWSWLPEPEMVGEDVLTYGGQARGGAYAAQQEGIAKDRVFINETLSAEEQQNIYMEEIGHFFDTELKGDGAGVGDDDSTGDEGQLFSAALSGELYDEDGNVIESVRAAAINDNDHGQITLEDGTTLDVEFMGNDNQQGTPVNVDTEVDQLFQQLEGSSEGENPTIGSYELFSKSNDVMTEKQAQAIATHYGDDSQRLSKDAVKAAIGDGVLTVQNGEITKFDTVSLSISIIFEQHLETPETPETPETELLIGVDELLLASEEVGMNQEQAEAIATHYGDLSQKLSKKRSSLPLMMVC